MTKLRLATVSSHSQPAWCRKTARASALAVLSGCLLLAGCDSQPAPNKADSSSQTTADAGGDEAAANAAQQKRKSRKPKPDPYADVNDPAKLLEAWQQQLAEKKYYLNDGDGQFRLEQFAFRYTWKFDKDGAVLTVEEHRGPNGELARVGRDILYLFIEEAEIDWGAAPDFIRNKDGKAGDAAVSSLKNKVIEEAIKTAEASTDLVDRTIGFETTDMAARQSAAYRTLVGSGAEFEGETVHGNIFDFRATAKFHEDDRVEAKLYVSAREDGGDAAAGGTAPEGAPAEASAAAERGGAQ